MVELPRAPGRSSLLFFLVSVSATAVLGGGLVLGTGGCKSGCGHAAPDGTDADAQAASVDSGVPTDPRGPADDELPPSIPGAAAAVNAVRPSLRACYAQQLGRRPTPRGTITFAIEVGPDGRVTAATPSAREGIDDECVACMTAGLKNATFVRPLDGLPATVIAPFTFHSRGEAAPGPLPTSHGRAAPAMP